MLWGNFVWHSVSRLLERKKVESFMRELTAESGRNTTGQLIFLQREDRLSNQDIEAVLTELTIKRIVWERGYLPKKEE